MDQLTTGILKILGLIWDIDLVAHAYLLDLLILLMIWVQPVLNMVLGLSLWFRDWSLIRPLALVKFFTLSSDRRYN